MSKGTLLVIEPDFDIRNMLTIYFTQKHFDIIAVKKGQGAKDFLSKRLPNLILMGNNIPDVDGFDLCVELRSSTRCKHIPIIFLTQKDERSEKIAGYELGADDFLSPPYDIEELHLRVMNAGQFAVPDSRPHHISMLPTGGVLSEYLHELLLNQVFDLIYIDLKLKTFDPFREIYSSQISDEIVGMTADILRQVKTEHGTESDFLGHIGWNNFAVITHAHNIQPLVDAVFSQFDEQVKKFYSEEDIKRGHMLVDDKEIPLMSLMYGICDVSTLDEESRTLRTIVELAADDRRRRYDQNNYPPIETAW